jgi:hypothetical protein
VSALLAPQSNASPALAISSRGRSPFPIGCLPAPAAAFPWTADTGGRACVASARGGLSGVKAAMLDHDAEPPDRPRPGRRRALSGMRGLARFATVAVLAAGAGVGWVHILGFPEGPASYGVAAACGAAAVHALTTFLSRPQASPSKPVRTEDDPA